MIGVNADAFNLEMNNFKDAGQVVFHTHIHIIPRFENDGLKHWPGQKYKDNENKEILDKIKSKLE